jgi:hypothetical protein
VGFAAGGSAGKASDPPEAPRTRAGSRDAGREVGGAKRTMPAVGRIDDAPALTVGLGRPGKPFAEEAEAEPQDALRDADERDDCTVEDLSFRTREVLFGAVVAVLEGLEAVIWAQPKGREGPLRPLGPGREG